MTTEDTKITEDEAQRQEDCEHDWYSTGLSPEHGLLYECAKCGGSTP